MNCTSPFRIYSTSAKLDYIEVPCGRCINCRINRTREWTMRLIQESDSWTNTIFVTLTYQDTALPVDSGLHKEDLQKFSSVSERIYPTKIEKLNITPAENMET